MPAADAAALDPLTALKLRQAYTVVIHNRISNAKLGDNTVSAGAFVSHLKAAFVAENLTDDKMQLDIATQLITGDYQARLAELVHSNRHPTTIAAFYAFCTQDNGSGAAEADQIRSFLQQPIDGSVADAVTTRRPMERDALHNQHLLNDGVTELVLISWFMDALPPNVAEHVRRSHQDSPFKTLEAVRTAAINEDTLVSSLSSQHQDDQQQTATDNNYNQHDHQLDSDSDCQDQHAYDHDQDHDLDDYDYQHDQQSVLAYMSPQQLKVITPQQLAVLATTYIPRTRF